MSNDVSTATERTQYILVEWKTGRDEHIDDRADLEEDWEAICDTPGVQFAVWYVPKKSGHGWRTRGVFGERRVDLAARKRTMQIEREQAAAQALTRMYDSRDWTYTADTSHHL